jgi:hypothetical protein
MVSPKLLSTLLSVVPIVAAVPWSSWSTPAASPTSSGWGSGPSPPPSSGTPNFDNVTIFQAPPSWPRRTTSYARVVLLNQNCEEDNVLLTTFTWSPPDGNPSYPVFSSHDQGQTWTQISAIYYGPETGKVFSNGSFLAQPDFLELPIQIGDYPAGTVLFTGMGQPADRSSTNIYVYASRDKG